MLRLQPNMLESFLSDHKKEVVKHLLSFVPQVIRDETDDLSNFIQRILQCARKNGAFSKTFVYKGRAVSDPADDGIRAFSMFILEHAHNVGLWEIQTESHATIDPNGDIHPYDIIIPQIELSWELDKGTKCFNCIVHFVEGDTQFLESWDV